MIGLKPNAGYPICKDRWISMGGGGKNVAYLSEESRIGTPKEDPGSIFETTER